MKDYRIISFQHQAQRDAVKSWEASGYHIIYYVGYQCEMKRDSDGEYITVLQDGTLK